MLESLLLSKGFRVYNISTSIPTEYIVNYIHDLQPDIVFISVTLEENIRPAERLIQLIRSKYDCELPLVVGGSAFRNTRYYHDNKNDVLFMKNASFDDIIEFVKVSIRTKQ